MSGPQPEVFCERAAFEKASFATGPATIVADCDASLQPAEGLSAAVNQVSSVAFGGAVIDGPWTSRHRAGH